jgi:hypothetical protein
MSLKLFITDQAMIYVSAASKSYKIAQLYGGFRGNFSGKFGAKCEVSTYTCEFYTRLKYSAHYTGIRVWSQETI